MGTCRLVAPAWIGANGGSKCYYEGKGPRPSRPRQNDIVKVGFVCTTVNPEKRQREEGLEAGLTKQAFSFRL